MDEEELNASICSKHQKKDLGCKLCQSTIYDLFPKEIVDHMRNEVMAVGQIECSNCGFAFYLTVSDCPACGCTDPVVDVMKK